MDCPTFLWWSNGRCMHPWLTRARKSNERIRSEQNDRLSVVSRTEITSVEPEDGWIFVEARPETGGPVSRYPAKSLLAFATLRHHIEIFRFDPQHRAMERLACVDLCKNKTPICNGIAWAGKERPLSKTSPVIEGLESVCMHPWIW